MHDLGDVRRQDWDALVIGTGVGGATLGHALARAGWRVLFLEKGRAAHRHADTLRGGYPELACAGEQTDCLRRGGRLHEAVRDGARSLIPLMGCGSGGSSALYGMAMERLFPGDFAAWPIDYATLAPYYDRAEALYGVRGGRDPLRPPAPELPPAPPLSPVAEELHTHFRHKGLHPYRLPQACDFLPGCACCQGYLCPRGCKRDAARACLEPALDEHGAVLLDECEALRIEADARRVTGVVCRRQGQDFTLRARQVILAAGALATPALLLRSASPDWPLGLANRSGLVGRHLMRHLVDLYLVFTHARTDRRQKELGLSDLYLTDGQTHGTLQSFGVLPPAALLLDDLGRELRAKLPWATPLLAPLRPLLAPLLDSLMARGVLLAAILEDLPHADNRVLPGPPLAIEYRLHTADQARLRAFRRRIRQVLRPYRFLALTQAEKNALLAHVCGTCRFGDDASTSVLDRHNRAHDLDNLWVVDASFFPTSGGTNPALTIAANALRVADTLLASESHHAPD